MLLLKNSIHTRGVNVCIVRQIIIIYLIFQTFLLAWKLHHEEKKWQTYLVIQYVFPLHRCDFLMSADKLNVCICCSSWGFSLTMKTGTGKCFWIFCLFFTYFVRVQTKTEGQIKRKSSISTLINTFAII